MSGQPGDTAGKRDIGMLFDRIGAHESEKTFHRDLGIGDGSPWQKPSKLFASEPTYDIPSACLLAEIFPKGPQHGISGGMTIPVINLFEVVEIQKGKGEGPLVTIGQGDLVSEMLPKYSRTIQPRQAVMSCLLVQGPPQVTPYKETQRNQKNGREYAFAATADHP